MVLALLGCDSYYSGGATFRPASSDIKQAEGCFNRGDKLYDKGEFERAIVELDLAIKLNPSHGHAHNIRGLCYYYLKDLDRAIKDYNQAIELLPMQSMGYYNRAMVYCDLSEYDKSIRDYSRSIELDPKRAIIFIGRANAYIGKKEYKKGIKDLDVAIDLDSTKAISFHNRGACWYFLGDLENAIVDYEAATKLDPTDFDYHFNLALALHDFGSTEKALASFTRSAAIDPYSAKVHNKIGWILATDENEGICDAPKAIEHAKQAVKLTSETDWDCIDTLATAYAVSGDFDQAKFWLTKALKLELSKFNRSYLDNKLELYDQELLEPEETSSNE